jgi:hypothetical protein
MAERIYRYGDFPYLFWDADPDAVLDAENPVTLCRILERGKLEDVWRLLTPGVIRRNLDKLPLPPHNRRFWRMVVDGPGAAG